jgi:hypothetical protein
MKVSVMWPDIACCFMPGASHSHKDVVGCTGIPFDLTTFILLKDIYYLEQRSLLQGFLRREAIL